MYKNARWKICFCICSIKITNIKFFSVFITTEKHYWVRPLRWVMVNLHVTWLLLKFRNDRSIDLLPMKKYINYLSPLNLFGRHDDDPGVFLPDHSPEISQSSRETTLCSYKTFLVGISRVFIHLIIIHKKKNNNNTILSTFIYISISFLLPLNIE